MASFLRRAWLPALPLLIGSVLSVNVAKAGKSNDTLSIALPRTATTLDGLYDRLRESHFLGLTVDDALYYVDHKTMQPVPLVASAHHFVDDRTLEVQLRKGVRFHDGSELTSEDVVYSYNWINNPASQTEFTERTMRWFETVEAVDSHTVRFKMKEPNPLVLYDLAYYSKLRKKGTYEDPGKPKGINPDAMTHTFNGLGPYRVVQFRPGESMTLERFDGYFKDSPKGRPAIKTIRVRTVPDPSTQAAEVMSGGIDWAYNLPADVAEAVGASGRGVHVSGPSMRIGYIVLDAAGQAQPKGPLTNVKVRQALSHAIDRDAIAKNLVRSGSQPLNVGCEPIQFGCPKDVPRYEYNPAKTKQMLAEAGYPNGFELEFWASREKPVMEAIAAQFSAAGVKTTLRFVKGPTMEKARADRQTAAFFDTAASLSIPDAGVSGVNRLLDEDRNYHQDAELERLLKASATTLDVEERRRALYAAYGRVAEQVYWIPVFTYPLEYAISKEVAFEAPKDGMPRLFLIGWK